MNQVKSIKKVLKHTIKETYDRETGELQLQEEVTDYSVSSEPAFVKLYLDGIQAIYKLNSSNHAFLNELLKITNYGGEIILNPAVKKRICAFLNSSIGTFDNTLLTLKRADIIRQKDRGCYMVNPELFGKGPWSEVYKDRAKYKKIKMTIEYSGAKQAKKTIKTEILNDDEAILVEANRRGITSEELLAEFDTSELGLDLNSPSPFDFDECEVE
ncbi:replication/maintenance protein RepL [Pseudomonas coleopterorum]|uniref:Replication/maintenance protein RepL n=1 Tax=Pseudomonas coleopterorum TaxID=1605838 RepID=A0ABR9C2S6_9PSED|nr:replication/maintenance protein RepL [Pseudomonas coleopterorum]MBD8495599.1 replication/maintenance protein RepL [Pseudomonas syringae]MBD8753685.1 replication/maintenance protein RepL [Pseudomonas coleopterorum]MBD8771013.1 replication/maintenance protein RepL [Pseudomonas coleopterorum]